MVQSTLSSTYNYAEIVTDLNFYVTVNNPCNFEATLIFIDDNIVDIVYEIGDAAATYTVSKFYDVVQLGNGNFWRSTTTPTESYDYLSNT